jgi:hypothetical protein
MAKSRTTAATTVEEPIVEQNIETTAVVEEPQTVSEEPQTVVEEPQTVVEEPQTVVEEPTENTPVEGDTTGGDTPQEDNTTTENINQTVSEEGNNELLTKFIKMSGINMPYAKEVMALPNFEYYLPIGSGINMEERSNLIAQIKEYNKPSEDNK